jgi:hypothetical protein
MSLKISELYALTDEQVNRNHDREARNTSVGTARWQGELERRSRERSTSASNRVALASFISSVVSVLIAIGALVVSLLR